MAAPSHHRGCHGSPPTREAEAQRAAPLVHRKTLRAPSRPRFVLRRLALPLVRPAKSHPPPPPLAPPLSPPLSPPLGLLPGRGASSPPGGQCHFSYTVLRAHCASPLRARP